MYPVEPEILRFRLVRALPCIATAVYRVIPTPQTGLGTFACDAKWRWYYDPEVPFDPDEQVTVLYHEICHLLRGHAGRMNQRDPKQWNIAGDLEINDDFPRGLPEVSSLLHPSMFKLDVGKFAEWYYDNVIAWDAHTRQDATPLSPGTGPCHIAGCDNKDRDPERGPGGKVEKRGVKHVPACGGCSGNSNEGEESEGGIGEVEGESIRRDVAKRIEGQSPGTAPGFLERWAKELLHPKVPWNKLLQTYARRIMVINAGGTDLTYSKGSRREFDPFIFPRDEGNKTYAAFYVDTSGSVGDDQLAQAMSEVCAALKTEMAEMWVSFLDVDVKSTHKIRTASQVKMLVPKGRGGTDMRVAFQHAQTLKPKPNMVVVLTDGETPWPEYQPPGMHTIVVLVPRKGYRLGRGTSPEWAKTVVIEDEN